MSYHSFMIVFLLYLCVLFTECSNITEHDAEAQDTESRVIRNSQASLLCSSNHPSFPADYLVLYHVKCF